MPGVVKMVVCGVWDSAVQAYGQPFYCRTTGEAIRSFMDEVNRKVDDNALARHPEDYELRLLAEFDMESGVFEQMDAKTLMRGKDVQS